MNGQPNDTDYRPVAQLEIYAFELIMDFTLKHLPTIVRQESKSKSPKIMLSL